MRALIFLALLGGCATSVYAPRLVARGELLLRYENGFALDAGGKRVAHAPTWAGLPEYVRCVPPAADLATRARRHGQMALGFAVTGGVLGGISIGGLAGFADQKNEWIWLGTGLATATVGVVFAGLSRLYRNRANQEAVDAHNYYNDSVGSLGATCDDLTYPPPSQPPE
jgi:hypothetical protein